MQEFHSTTRGLRFSINWTPLPAVRGADQKEKKEKKEIGPISNSFDGSRTVVREKYRARSVDVIITKKSNSLKS